MQATKLYSICKCAFKTGDAMKTKKYPAILRDAVFVVQ